MDTREATHRWAETWLSGWQAPEAEGIVALYREDSAEPWFGEPVVEADRPAVEWRAFTREDGREVTLSGIVLLRFDEDGLCLEQRDAWAVADGRVERAYGSVSIWARWSRPE